MFQAKFKISRPVQINRPQQPKQLQQQPLDGIPFSQGQGADVSTLDAFGQALHAQIVLKGGSVRAAAVLVPKAFGVRLPPVPGRVSLKAYILENALHFYWNKHAFRTGEHIQVITPSAGTESSAQNGAGNGTALVYTPEPGLGMQYNDDDDNDDRGVIANATAAPAVPSVPAAAAAAAAAAASSSLPPPAVAAAVMGSNNQVEICTSPSFVLPKPLDGVLTGSCGSTPEGGSIGISFDNLSESTSLLYPQTGDVLDAAALFANSDTAVSTDAGNGADVMKGGTFGDEKVESTNIEVYYRTVVQTIIESGLGNAVESVLLSANATGVQTSTLVNIIMPVRVDTTPAGM